jgi:hypothetical protein
LLQERYSKLKRSIFDAIEDSKNRARIKMHDAKTQTEKSYYIGQIGGLQIAKQHLEKIKDE